MVLRRIFSFFILLSLFSGRIEAQSYRGGIQLHHLIESLEQGECIDVTINSSDPDFSVQLVEGKIDFKRYLRSFYSVKICHENLDIIDGLTNINYFEISQKPYLLNDSMLVNNGILSLHSGQAAFRKSYKGNGVLMGFIDTGIDFSHPDFQDSTGKTRILSIWDQGADTLISSRIPQWKYGQLWDSSDINAGNCPHDDDILSHGTNVAGIAAGNGNALGKYEGVAGESAIIYVASDFSSNNWLPSVADGVEYIFLESERLNMPCVINISAGEYLGSHDGSDLSALRIDSMIKAKRGRAIVAAAGNAGNQFFHLGYQVSSDTNFTWFQYNSNTVLGHGAVYYQLWADTADFNQVTYAFGTNKPSPSFQYRGRTSFVTIDSCLNKLHVDSIKAGSNLIARVETYAQLMGDKYLLEVHIPNVDSSQYLFSLMTAGNGAFDIWSDSWLGLSKMVKSPLPGISQYPAIAYYKEPDTLQTMVSSFTCLPSVITVANYTNRNSYLDYDSVLQTFPVITGKRADPSSLGPNRKGDQKPDLIASGDFTLTANRLASIPLHLANNQADRIALGGMHKRNGGTSMASPVVAGIAALMLEECAMMSYDEIKERLITTTYSDSLTGALPNYQYGYGKVRADSAMLSNYFTSFISPGNKIAFCLPDSVELSGPENMSLYLWSTGDTSRTINVDSSGMVILTTTDASDCMSDADTVLLTGNEAPAKPIIEKFGKNLLESTPANSYKWYKDGVLLSGKKSRQLVVLESGSYEVEVFNEENCSAFSDPFNMYLGIVETAEWENVSVYPNPSSDGYFRVVCPSCAHSKDLLKLEIFDSKASFVKSEFFDPDESMSFYIQQPGLYYFRISENGKLRAQGKISTY